MRDHPEIVRAAVLDSVVPMEEKMFNRRGRDTQLALDKIFADCAANVRCNAAYPDLDYVFKNLVEQFDKKPATIKAYDPVTGYTSDDIPANGVDLLSAVVAGMHHSELVPVIPKAIYDIQKGDYTFLTYALGARGGTIQTTSMGTYFSTVCPEQVYVSTQDELDADLNITPLIKEYALTGLFGSTQNLFALCDAWGTRMADPQDNQPVRADIPTLVISGQYDPTTPSATGELVANDLPGSHFYVIPGMGHGATIGNSCSLTMTLAFLKDPQKEPDSACLQAKKFEFFLPYDGKEPVDLVATTDSLNGLEEMVPATWKRKRADGSYFRNAYLFDVTMVQATAFPHTQTTVLESLTKSFKDSGFTGTPKKVETHRTNGLSWTVYTSKFNGEPIFVALAQVNSARTVALIMITSAPERDALYKGLFIPMLDGLIPMW
jgi:pimeloyl-ACP methyl ester carboxylesterase